MYTISNALRGRKVFLFLRIEQMRANTAGFVSKSSVYALPKLERMSKVALWGTFSLDSITLNKISIASDYSLPTSGIR